MVAERNDLNPEYSFVIPILDEIDSLELLYDRVRGVMDALDGAAEAILVDDGSTDGSYERMLDMHRRDPRFIALRLSRNFGHQIAITAGLDHARGQAVIIMDGDLQDPPEVALDLARRWREGYDVVYAVRDARAGESRGKLMTARWFYRIMNRLGDVPLPPDAGDFRLVDRRALDGVIAMREHRRYLRGMFAWIGYNQSAVHYEREARQAGKTKFSGRRMIGFAADGVVSFSAAPLRAVLSGGFVVSLLSLVGGITAIILKITGTYTVPGWASIVVGIALLGGIQLTVLGVIGEYVARIHEEVKRRPLYFVRDSIGLPNPGDAGARRNP